MAERDNLNTILRSFIDGQKGWPFFVGLKDYVNYIQETEGLRKLTETLLQKREELRLEEERLEKVTLEELLAVRDDLVLIIKKNKLSQNQQLQSFLLEIERFLKGEIRSNQMLSDSLDHLLFNICINFPEENRDSILQKYVDKNPEATNIYGDFLFSSTLKDRRKVTEAINHARDTELWGEWIKLSLAPKFIEAVSIYEVPLADGDGHFSFKLINARIEYDKAHNDKEFTELIPEYRQSVLKINAYLLRMLEEPSDQSFRSKRKQAPTFESLHLVTSSLEPTETIFLVLDGHFDMPIRSAVKNKSGGVAYIKKLYDIAYLVNVPGKKVGYDEGLADCINNGLFRKAPVEKYMRTNHLRKPTLVQKSEDGEILVLRNEIPVKTMLVKNVPTQHQSLYTDKTR